MTILGRDDTSLFVDNAYLQGKHNFTNKHLLQDLFLRSSCPRSIPSCILRNQPVFQPKHTIVTVRHISPRGPLILRKWDSDFLLRASGRSEVRLRDGRRASGTRHVSPGGYQLGLYQP